MDYVSHLLQMRGLKLREDTSFVKAMMSHLLQMRGLKHYLLMESLLGDKVASFTDAWIETKT